ncbi:MAG: AMP-dependent synthetase/ligase [Solirubrobacteraceae bacterium]
MSTEQAAPSLDVESPIQASTVCEAFQRLVAQKPDQLALRTRDGVWSLTWSELNERVKSVAAGLAGLGIGHGDTVAMLLPNVPECHLVDLAAVHLGAVPFTIYNSSSAEQLEHKLDNADARILFTTSEFLPRVNVARASLPKLEQLVVIDAQRGESMALADVEATPAPEGFDFEATWRAVEAEDLVTLIYTSGTTGPPKGAEWVHRTVMSQLRALDAVLPLPTENVISVLPMAHAGGRLTGHYFALPFGPTITCCPDLKELPLFLAELHPDVFFAVPRLWEKLQVAIETMVEGMPEAERAAAKQAIAAGDAYEPVKPILARLGLERIKAAYVGGAPSAPELSEFFRAVGVPLLEAYGLTEGSLNIFNRIEEFKGGTAGKPLPGVELRLEGDGEILLRGGLNFIGYRKQPEETAETLDAEGWLHTGDIAVLDADGFVTIVDRKKEIIIGAAGKNMSPANIESAIKGESSLIGQVVTIGDGRRYNTGLITLDLEAAPMYGKRLGLADGASFAELAASPEIHAEVAAAVERGNARLSRVEQIKKFTLLGVAWMPDSDELTPTMKLKRKPIAAKYAAEIEALYED